MSRVANAVDSTEDRNAALWLEPKERRVLKQMERAVTRKEKDIANPLFAHLRPHDKGGVPMALNDHARLIVRPVAVP